MKRFTRTVKLMGCRFQLGVICSREEQAIHLLDMGVREMARIEGELTEFDESSITSAINTAAGKDPISIPGEVFELINRSGNISKLTQGYFDISVGPLKQLYKFKNDDFSLPPKKVIRKTLNQTGQRYIELNEKLQTVRLLKPGMKISFAAIGKGYAADRVRDMWRELGVTGGFINASGDLCAFGLNENGEPWNIGIANPDHPDKMMFHVPLINSAVATSGDYEQHFIYKGKRYSHNINPKTGMPVEQLKSVSVFSPQAELSDALATAVSAMGLKKGLSFIDQLPNTHCIIIDVQNHIHFSKQLAYEAVS